MLRPSISTSLALNCYEPGASGVTNTSLKKYNPRTVSKPKKSPAQQLKESERKNRELQKELEYHKLRADALDKLIEVGERELNISIRKKSGSKL